MLCGDGFPFKFEFELSGGWHEVWIGRQNQQSWMAKLGNNRPQIVNLSRNQSLKLCSHKLLTLLSDTMPRVLPYIPTKKIPSSLDPVKAGHSIALFKPLGIKREDEWRREMADVHWNCNLQHWTDKTASSVQRYVRSTIEWQLHQKFTAGSKQHLERMDRFWQKQKEDTKRERAERQAELDKREERRLAKLAESAREETKELERAVVAGESMAVAAAGSPVGEDAPWTDESKQLAVARSMPTPRRLLGKRNSAESFVDRVERKVRRAARGGPRSFTVQSFSELLSCDDTEGSVPRDLELRGDNNSGYPGAETASEANEREAIEKELKDLARA